MGRELVRRGFASECKQWGLWDRPSEEFKIAGLPALRVFQCQDEHNLSGLERHIRESGQPDLLWVEGCKQRPLLAKIFELCPDSYKIVYPKYHYPWQVDRLDGYDLCLVDEDWQVEAVRSRCPAVHCGVWDKLIDYEGQHYPMAVEKVFDICYVAHFSGRKNHELLLRAMAKLDRRLSCALVGGDKQNYRAGIEACAAQLGVRVHFAGPVTKGEVNRYVNQSSIGVICSEKDAVPRALLEYMAADVPVLVNANLLAGTRYVGPKAGLVRAPEDFHLGLAELIETAERYRPREHLLQDFSHDRAVERFVNLLRQARGS
jgi:glycosyltransferase involved in cell wall biosynthesis